MGPLLGLYQTWTKRSDHAPKSGCVFFFKYMSIKGQFWEFSSCLTFSPSSSFLPHNYEENLATKKKKMKIAFLCHGTLTFAMRDHFLHLSLQYPSDHDGE